MSLSSSKVFGWLFPHPRPVTPWVSCRQPVEKTRSQILTVQNVQLGLIWASGFQDLYRHLALPRAQNCLLRVRTSPEIRVGRFYGRVFKDPMYDDMYHMMGCDVFDTVAVDFEFVNKAGFDRSPGAPATVQIAFQYSIVVAPADGDGQRLPKLQRRMRICTMQVSRPPGALRPPSGCRWGGVLGAGRHSRQGKKRNGKRYWFVPLVGRQDARWPDLSYWSNNCEHPLSVGLHAFSAFAFMRSLLPAVCCRYAAIVASTIVKCR